MKLNTLLDALESYEIDGSDHLDISDIAFDSRRVKAGVLFIAVPGLKRDGTEFVPQAVANGAVAVVSERRLKLDATVTNIIVPSARRAMAELTCCFYHEVSKDLLMVGVTGTNGKTTTSYLIRKLLIDGGYLPGLVGTVAYEIGARSIPSSRTTPEAPDLHSMLQQMKRAACDSAVLEVSSHAIDLDRVYGIDFNCCVFTNLTQDHLDYHNDMESYYGVKAKLFQMIGKRQNQFAVVNVDDPWGSRLVEETRDRINQVTFGFDSRAMVQACGVEVNEKGCRFQALTPWGDADVRLHLQGRFNVHNALAALAVGGVLGIDLKLMAQSLSNFTTVPGRLEQVENRRHRTVFVDYAHTEDALKNVLTTLREICKGKLYVVFGCGGNRDQGKRMRMGRVAAQLADFSIITSDNPRNEDPAGIALDIAGGFDGREVFALELDRRKAIEMGLNMLSRKDILLVAGKGHETYQESKGTIVPFDDRETVREILG